MTLNEYFFATKQDKEKVEYLKESLRSFLRKNFTSDFAKELIGYLDKIKIVFKERKDDVVAMTFSDKEITINPKMFYARSNEEQMAYLAHELIHVSEKKGNTKVKSLNRKLWDFYETNKIDGTDVSMVMVGKPRVSRRWVNKHECVNYLLTEKVHFEYLEPGSKEEFKELLEKYKLFNLDSQFWKNRLDLI